MQNSNSSEQVFGWSHKENRTVGNENALVFDSWRNGWRSLKFLVSFFHVFQVEYFQGALAFCLLFYELIDFSEAAGVNETHLKHWKQLLTTWGRVVRPYGHNFFFHFQKKFFKIGSTVAVQSCISFCCTTQWISYKWQSCNLLWDEYATLSRSLTAQDGG